MTDTERMDWLEKQRPGPQSWTPPFISDEYFNLKSTGAYWVAGKKYPTYRAAIDAAVKLESLS